MTAPWLSIIGIGEDGLAGLTPVARKLIDEAEVLIGGARHLAMAPPSPAERLTWATPLTDTVSAIAARRGKRVAVLATGDPMWFGIGVTLARRFPRAEMIVLPHISAFTLAAAHMGWPLADLELVSLHGRPLDLLALHLAPGARLLALSENGDTPASVARFLVARGWGPSALTVLEHLGGPNERRIDGTAEEWRAPRTQDLNTIAIECRPGPGARILSRAPGLPDDAFVHDGQLTKREIRAATLAALAPLPGQLLWDVGAGSGAVAIEWMRAARGARAVAVERDADRRAFIAKNAAALGVPKLAIVAGDAPAALAGLAPPDAVFVGGGLSTPGLVEACWTALAPGGRLVANAVTVEGESALIAWQAKLGGALARIAVSRTEPVGGFQGWRPLTPVTQWNAVK
ncbi:MAG: precorrin-6y C5,15-methyltransferase (decarboxylating) subunit CbiE [Rhodospirillales bacterium]|nr:precorrin-6y C5,15-methyltransferase (decarboxylating) subunit CbiE [Rhodospirillales bacterium]